jgi:hypothetical protein
MAGRPRRAPLSQDPPRTWRGWFLGGSGAGKLVALVPHNLLRAGTSRDHCDRVACDALQRRARRTLPGQHSRAPGSARRDGGLTTEDLRVCLIPGAVFRLPFADDLGRLESEEETRFVGVVRAAPQLNVCSRRGAAGRVRLRVMKLEEASLNASSAAPDERTAPLVTAPDLAPHRGGDVARRVARLSAAAWRRRLGVSTTLQVLEQHGQSAVKDRGQVTVWNRVPQQILRAAQPVVRLARDRELDLVAVRGQRRDRRTR